MPQDLDWDQFLKEQTVDEKENRDLGPADWNSFLKEQKYSLMQPKGTQPTSTAAASPPIGQTKPVIVPPAMAQPPGTTVRGEPTRMTPAEMGQRDAELAAIDKRPGQPPMSLMDKAAEAGIQLGQQAIAPIKGIYDLGKSAYDIATGKSQYPKYEPKIPYTNEGNPLEAAGLLSGAALASRGASGWTPPVEETPPPGGGTPGFARTLFNLYKAGKKLTPTGLAEGLVDKMIGKEPAPPPAAKANIPKPATTPRPTAPPKPLSPKDAAAKALADAQAQITSGTSTTGAGTSLPTPTAPPQFGPVPGFPGEISPAPQNTPFVRTINAPTPAPAQPVPGRQLPTAAQTFPNTAPIPPTGPAPGGTIPSPPAPPAPPPVAPRSLPTAVQQFPNTPPAPPPMGGPQGGTIPLEPPPPPAYSQPTAAQQFPNTPPAPPVGPAPGATPIAPAFNMQGVPELPPGPTQGTSAYGGKPLPGTEIYGHTNKSPRASTAKPAEAEAAAEAEVKPEVKAETPPAAKPDVKSAAEALAEEVVPGGKAGEVRTIPAGESNFSPEEAKKVNSLLKTMRGKGMTPDTFKTMNPDQQSTYLKGIEEGMAHHGPKIVKAVLDKLRGEAYGGITIPDPPKMAHGGTVVPEEPTDWTKLKFNRIFSADTTTQAAKRLATDTGAPIAKRTRQLSADNRTFLNFVRTELDTHDPQEKVAWVLPDANANVLSQWVAGGARNNLALGKAKAHTSGVQRLSKINGRVALDSGSGPGIYIVRSQS